MAMYLAEFLKSGLLTYTFNKASCDTLGLHPPYRGRATPFDPETRTFLPG